MTQTELSELTGIDPTWISNFSRTARFESLLEKLAIIKNALGVELDDLIYLPEYEKETA